MRPPPMWKLTGTPASRVTFQIGSQCVSHSGGWSYFSGALQKLMPRWPAPTARSISATDASTSQNGTDTMGNSRSGATDAKSVWKSL